MGFEETNLKMSRISSNIIPTLVKNNSTLQIKSNELRQKDYDIGNNRKWNNIQLKRVGEQCSINYKIKKLKSYIFSK